MKTFLAFLHFDDLKSSPLYFEILRALYNANRQGHCYVKVHQRILHRDEHLHKKKMLKYIYFTSASISYKTCIPKIQIQIVIQTQIQIVIQKEIQIRKYCTVRFCINIRPSSTLTTFMIKTFLGFFRCWCYLCFALSAYKLISVMMTWTIMVLFG